MSKKINVEDLKSYIFTVSYPSVYISLHKLYYGTFLKKMYVLPKISDTHLINLPFD